MKKLIIFLTADEAPSLRLLEETKVHAYVQHLGEASANEFEANVQEPETEFIADLSIGELLERFKRDIEDKNIRTTVVIPDEELLNCQVKVPGRQFKQVQKALPYLIEDQVAADPEDCFIAVGERRGELLACSVVNREAFETLHRFLVEQGLSPERIVSDASLVLDGDPSIHVFGDRVILVNSSYESYAFDKELISVYLEKLKTTEEGQPDSADDSDEEQASSLDLDNESIISPTLNIYLYSNNEDETEQESFTKDLQDFKQQNGLDLTLEYHKLNTESFYQKASEFLSDRSASKHLTNLMQGEFKPQRIRSSFNLDLNWKPAAILLAVLVFLHLVFIVLEKNRYESTAKLADQQTKEVFRQIFPNTKNYSAMRKRVAALLRGSSDTGDNHFLRLFHGFFEQVSAINKSVGGSLSPLQVQFDQGSGQLKVDFLAKNFEVLNGLKEKVNASGMNLEIVSTSTESVGIKGRVRVTLAEQGS